MHSTSEEPVPPLCRFTNFLTISNSGLYRRWYHGMGVLANLGSCRSSCRKLGRARSLDRYCSSTSYSSIRSNLVTLTVPLISIIVCLTLVHKHPEPVDGRSPSTLMPKCLPVVLPIRLSLLRRCHRSSFRHVGIVLLPLVYREIYPGCFAVAPEVSGQLR
jgi:hypothetical protein